MMQGGHVSGLGAFLASKAGWSRTRLLLLGSHDAHHWRLCFLRVPDHLGDPLTCSMADPINANSKLYQVAATNLGMRFVAERPAGIDQPVCFLIRKGVPQ